MMKKFFLFIIFILIAGISTAKDIFFRVERGNEYYLNGEYESAIKEYQAVIDSGFESAELYYNLGNAYYKSHKITMALVNYEKANLLKPGDKEILHNLEMTRQMVVDKIDKLPEFMPRVWYRRFIGLLKTDQWAYLSMVAFPLSLILVLIYLFVRNTRIRKLSFWLGILLMVISLSAFLFSWHQKRLVYHHSYAIILSPSVTIKSSPDESGTELFNLHEGTKVEIIDQLGEWKEIRLSDGNVGWVRMEDLIKL
jgi:tetratricopeptide (TPR) repeat protein